MDPELDLVKVYLSKLTQRAASAYKVAESQTHLGHILLQALREHPEFILQVDVGTGSVETFDSTRKKVVRLAIALSRSGYKTGDVILAVIPNSESTGIVFYASSLIGLPILPINVSSTFKEIEHFVKIAEPKIVFCMKDNVNTVKNVLESKGIEAKFIILDDPTYDIEAFIDENGSIASIEVESFTPSQFPKSTLAFLVTTSGTTGVPKVAMVSHDNLLFSQHTYLYYFNQYPKPTKSTLILASPEWLSTIMIYFGSAIFVFTRLQTTDTLTTKRCADIFTTHKPTLLVGSPTKFLEFINGNCDFSSVEYVFVGGSSLIEKLEHEFRRYPKLHYTPAYGMTEVFGLSLLSQPNGPSLNVGTELLSVFQYRLVDPSTGKEIKEPNVGGEMWMKCNSPFPGYYKNPEETAKIFSHDGYVKSGDLMYKDKDGYYFFVERLKLFLKYEDWHVYPSEIEEVLRNHPSVADAAVTSIKDTQKGDLPLAFVQLKDNCKVSAKELRDLVAKELSDYKQLRGGVIFVSKLPQTATNKVNRPKLREFTEQYKNKIEY